MNLPRRGCGWGFKTKLQHTHFLMVMSFFALSFCPYLSISDATRHKCDNILKAVGKEKELDNGLKPKSSRERRALKKGK